MLKTIKQIKNLKNKIVLLRGDLDVPLKNGRVVPNFRLRRLLPTIEYLTKKHVKKIVIIGHIGRPEGKFVQSLSMEPAAKELAKLLSIKKEIKKFKNENFEYFSISEKIDLLENLRFDKGEEQNNLKFAKKLANLGDIYVNDAFSVCHRKHSSIVGITKFLPSCAGLNLIKEIKVLSGALNKPKRPAAAIIGGAKIKTKLPLINKFSKRFDSVLIGGKLGLETPIPKKIKNVIFPVDYKGKENLDIGQQTIKLYSKILKSAKTVVWNGPMGKFEEKAYIEGTKKIAEIIIKSKAYSIVGGGDIIAALNKLKMLDKMGFVSSGGGAMLEFLEKGKLCGIEVLKV